MTTGAHGYEVRDSEIVYRGKVWDIRRDVVAMPDGREVAREVMVHPGAVAVVALDDQLRVLLIRQYRHPTGEHLWEIPAGLLDAPGEKASETARRELVEEAGLEARTWHLLVDVYSTPGASDEAIRVYLARDLSHVGRPAHQPDEEADLTPRWAPLGDAVSECLSGEVRNGTAVVGILAAAEAERRGFAELRPVDLAWPARPDHAG